MKRFAWWLWALSSIYAGLILADRERPLQMDAPFDKVLEYSTAADQKRDQAIVEILKVVDRVGLEKKGELIFRLAETYWEKAKYAYNKEYQEFDASYQKWIDSGRQGAEPNLATFVKEASELRKKAIYYYQVVLKEHANYSRRDEVLYMLAYSLYEAGKKQEAIENYLDLIRHFEKSIYVGDAYLALGEHHFELNDATRAAKAYAKAYQHGLHRGRTATYIYALYKHAWCDFNLHAFQDALDRWKQVVSINSQGRDAIQLRREALVDMVRAYAQLGETTGAYQYFISQIDKKQTYELIKKLAMAYQGQGTHRKEIEALQILIEMDVDAEETARHRAFIMKAYSQLNEKSLVKKEAEQLPLLCKNNSNGNGCKIAEQTLRELVLHYHRFADKIKQKDDYELARDLYEIYGQTFATSEDAYRLQFFEAEVLWDLKEWAKAADIYERVIVRNPEGEFSRAAALNAMLAREKILGDSTKNNEDKASIPLSETEKKWIVACERFEQLVGKNPADQKDNQELLRISSKIAQLYRSHFLLEEAERRFSQIISKWPNTANALVALYNTMLLYRDSNRRALAMNAGIELLSKSKREVGTIRQEVIAMLADLNEEGMELGLAAKWNEEFATQFPTAFDAAARLHNAAFFHYISGNWNEALDLFARYLKQFPRQKDIEEVKSLMARASIKANDVKRALAIYGDMKGQEARYRRVELLMKMGKKPEALKICHDLLRSDSSNSASAFCAFHLLEKDWDAYQKIVFHMPMAQLKKGIQLKRVRMNELGRAYLDVLKYKNAEWGVASLYRVAEIQLEYVRSLREIPAPQGLNDEALELFRAELENIVFPVEEEAISALEKALEKALELGVYADVLEKIQERLSHFDKKQRAKRLDMPFFVRGQRVGDLKTQDPNELKKALLFEADSRDNWVHLAFAYFARNQNELCEWLIERVEKMQGEQADLLNLRGLLRLREHDYSATALFFKRALEIDAHHLDALMNWGALASKFGDKKNAFEAYGRAVAIKGAPQLAFE